MMMPCVPATDVQAVQSMHSREGCILYLMNTAQLRRSEVYNGHVLTNKVTLCA